MDLKGQEVDEEVYKKKEVVYCRKLGNEISTLVVFEVVSGFFSADEHFFGGQFVLNGASQIYIGLFYSLRSIFGFGLGSVSVIFLFQNSSYWYMFEC